MAYTDDPVRDFLLHDIEQARRLDQLPRCDYCGKPIQGDHYFDINGDTLCERCLIREFRKDVDDYAE